MSKSNRIRKQKLRTSKTRDAREAAQAMIDAARARLVPLDEQVIRFLVGRGWKESQIREAMEAGCIYYNPDRNTLSTELEGDGIFKGL